MTTPGTAIKTEMTETEMATVLTALRLLREVLRRHARFESSDPGNRQLLTELLDFCELDPIGLTEHEVAILYQRLLGPLTVNAS